VFACLTWCFLHINLLVFPPFRSAYRSSMSSVAVSPYEDHSNQPGFDKLFSLKHIYYCGWMAAIHGTYWGLIFSWTTFFGILRDGGGAKALILWLFGSILFVSCAHTVYTHAGHDDAMRRMILHGFLFFGCAMLCTLSAGEVSAVVLGSCLPPVRCNIMMSL
jgi:hypothetical protein